MTESYFLKSAKKYKLKYWLLTTEYPPFFGGGIGTYCAITAKMLAEEGTFCFCICKRCCCQ